MNAQSAKQSEEIEDVSEDTLQTKSLADNQITDNVGDASVEINVEELIHELEADGLTEACAEEHAAAKRRLEDVMEKRRSKQEIEDFDDYDL